MKERYGIYYTRNFEKKKKKKNATEMKILQLYLNNLGRFASLVLPKPWGKTLMLDDFEQISMCINIFFVYLK